mgnify:CR=1 FL=1
MTLNGPTDRKIHAKENCINPLYRPKATIGGGVVLRHLRTFWILVRWPWIHAKENYINPLNRPKSTMGGPRHLCKLKIFHIELNICEKSETVLISLSSLALGTVDGSSQLVYNIIPIAKTLFLNFLFIWGTRIYINFEKVWRKRLECLHLKSSESENVKI